MLDNKQTFGINSGDYARFRPTYPKVFYEFLTAHLVSKDKAWDCACGTGQVAKDLTGYFNEIYATDISKNQIENAFRHPKIKYAVSPAEQTDFPNNFFDLIGVGQALHWFDIDKFFKEANRVLKRNGILAVFGYGFFKVNKDIDQILDTYLYATVEPYWSDRNMLVINGFEGIDFPFQPVAMPEFDFKFNWQLSDMLSYISTWSAVKIYNSKHKIPLEKQVFERLEKIWINEKDVYMPFFSFVRLK